MEVVDSVVTAAGPLLGVAVGSWLSQLQARRGWRQQLQLRTERVQAYTRFITAARTWQSNVPHPAAKIATA